MKRFLVCAWLACVVYTSSFGQEQELPNQPPSQSSPKSLSRQVEFSAEEEARTKLAQAVIEGLVPIDHVPPAQTSQAEKHIYKALDELSSVDFDRVALVDAVQHFADKHKIQFWINTPELELLGVAVDTELSLKLEDIRLRSILSMLLDPLELTFVVRNGIVEITSMDAAEYQPVNEVYRLPNRLARRMDDVINVIQQTVEPDSWLANGGTSSLLPLENLLIVSAPTTTHYEIQELLSKIVEKYGTDIRDKPY